MCTSNLVKIQNLIIYLHESDVVQRTFWICGQGYRHFREIYRNLHPKQNQFI